MKVYIVMDIDDGYDWVVDKVFADKDAAEKYMQECGSLWMEERLIEGPTE